MWSLYKVMKVKSSFLGKDFSVCYCSYFWSRHLKLSIEYSWCIHIREIALNMKVVFFKFSMGSFLFYLSIVIQLHSSSTRYSSTVWKHAYFFWLISFFVCGLLGFFSSTWINAPVSISFREETGNRFRHIFVYKQDWLNVQVIHWEIISL